jgi:hypothetical protein
LLRVCLQQSRLPKEITHDCLASEGTRARVDTTMCGSYQPLPRAKNDFYILTWLGKSKTNTLWQMKITCNHTLASIHKLCWTSRY